MNKFLLCSLLAAASVAFVPGESKAFWNSPSCCHGYGWLDCHALNCMPWIHMHGPLYSYGPYTTQGYQNQYVRDPLCGAYIPAYPATYYGFGGNYYGNAPYLGAQGAPPAAATAPAPPRTVEPVAPPAPVTTTSYSTGKSPTFLSSLRGRFQR